MVRTIVRDIDFLSKKSEEAKIEDINIAYDMLTSLKFPIYRLTIIN